MKGEMGVVPIVCFIFGLAFTSTIGVFSALGAQDYLRPYPTKGHLVAQNCVIDCGFDTCSLDGTVTLTYYYLNQTWVGTAFVNDLCSEDCCVSLARVNATVWLEVNPDYPEIVRAFGQAQPWWGAFAIIISISFWMACLVLIIMGISVCRDERKNIRKGFRECRECCGSHKNYDEIN